MRNVQKVQSPIEVDTTDRQGIDVEANPGTDDVLVETWTGSMRRREAIAQIAAIPGAIFIGFILLVVGWMAT